MFLGSARSLVAEPVALADPLNLAVTFRQTRGYYLFASTSGTGAVHYFAVYFSSASGTLILYCVVQGDAACNRQRAILPVAGNDGKLHQLLITVSGDVMTTITVSPPFFLQLEP